ncbi:MAG: nucleotide exchange factor GrpE [Treponema sp.]|nr:nucleotide exchange factor GrpE [Treponema sp.]
MEADRTDSVPNGDPAGTETPAQDASQNPVGDAGSGDPAGAAAAGGTGPAGAGAESGPEDRVADLEAQLAEAKDQFLRKVADFENFRKRMIREKQDAIDFANQSLLTDLIPILDDFDRALQSAQNSRDFAALYEGVGMIAKRLSSTLESKWGLKSYLAAGALFDPNFHEALMMEKSSAVDEQTVQFDLLKGYTLKDRVIRSAKVKVLIPDPSAPAIAAPVSPDAGGTGDNAAGGAHGNAAGAGTGEVKAGEAQS